MKTLIPIKPVWKYQKKCCNECDKEYLTDNMMGIEEGKNNLIWYCLKCYNFLKP
tara:strand:+ start:248 stop:409 length:162 start_codon:yes stop_codon:yes gene_type:complete